MTPDEIDDWLGSVYTRTVNCDFREQQEVIDVLNYGTTWKRYYVNNDEIEVERIDPRTVYFDTLRDLEAALPAVDDERRFAVVGEYVNISWNSHGYFLDPPSPYVRYRDPQTRLTHVAVAVKIALDGSVN